MIYAIADLHLPSTLGKTMDRFGAHWEGHPEKLRRNWIDRVGSNDSVLVCGDISWAMRPEQARPDLEFIASLPGTKYLIRGNHDYWWRRNATHHLQRSLPTNLVLVQGDEVVIEGIGVAGTRGWAVETATATEADEKVSRRELGFLHKALETLPDGPRVAMLHYPPYDPGPRLNAFGHLLVEMKVALAVFGHLHLGNPHGFDGNLAGVEFQWVAADRVDFWPQPLRLPTLAAKN